MPRTPSFNEIPRRVFLKGLGAVVTPTNGRARTLEETSVIVGQFALRPCLTLYLNAPKTEWWVSVDIARINPSLSDQISIRQFGPEEHILNREYFEWPAQPHDNDIRTRRFIYLHKSGGVHQIRLLAGSQNSVARIALSQSIDWAVSSHNGTFSPIKTSRRQYWIYIPKAAKVFRCRGAQLKLRHHNKSAATLQSAELVLKTAVGEEVSETPIEQTDVIWSAVLHGTRIRLRTAGFPVLWCCSPRAANLFKASVEVLPDKSSAHHKFQADVWNSLQHLLRTADFGDAQTLINKLYDRSSDWTCDPLRNHFLLSKYGPWPLARQALQRQRLDGNVKGAGGFGLPHALGPSYADALASVATIDARFNRLYRSPQIVNRAVVASFRNLLAIDEGEYWVQAGQGAAALDPYPGFMAFEVAHHGFPEFAKLAPLVAPHIRALWETALQRLVDRHEPMNLVTTRNQSAHYLVAWAMFAKGAKESAAAKFANRAARRYFDSVMPAGYQQEAYGPDATYAGMQHWHIAYYYHLSKDQRALKSLASSYRFFNHTVAPQHDGTITGSSDFSHRTGGSFEQEQWGGAKCMLGSTLPEIGLWAPKPVELQKATVAAGDQIAQALKFPPNDPYSINIHGPCYEYYETAGTTKSVWPALRRAKEEKNLGDELITINRSGYYAAIYVGNPSPYSNLDHQKVARKALELKTKSILNRTDVLEAKASTYGSAFSGGGLSILWTPMKGLLVTSKNWSPLTVHGLLIFDTNGDVTWPAYSLTSWRWLQAGKKLRITGVTFGSEVAWSRTYEFADEKISVSVAIEPKSSSPNAPFRIVENIPVLTAGSIDKDLPFTIESVFKDEVNVAEYEIHSSSLRLRRIEIESLNTKKNKSPTSVRQFHYALKF